MTPAELRARHTVAITGRGKVCRQCDTFDLYAPWPCDTIQACDHYDRLRHDVLEEAAMVAEQVGREVFQQERDDFIIQTYQAIAAAIRRQK